MKYLLSIVLISCLSFTYINYEASNRTAEVEQYQGLHIFVSSQPVMDYEYLGTVSVSIAWSAQFEGVKNKLIKKEKLNTLRQMVLF